MDLLLQDLAVTGVALGAAFVLIRRVQGAVFNSRKSPACGSCPNCDEKRGAVRQPPSV